MRNVVCIVKYVSEHYLSNILSIRLEHDIAHAYHQLDTFAFKHAFASAQLTQPKVESTKLIISNGFYMIY